MSGSYGGGAWGGLWGGGPPPVGAGGALPTSDPWDVFDVCNDIDIENLASFTGVNLYGAGGSFSSGPGFFGICSGFSGAPTTPTAHIQFDVNVNESFTLEWRVTFSALPDDFLDLPDEHMFLGAQSLASSTAGLFISDDGLLYTGAVSFSGTNLVVASPTIPIPGTAGICPIGVEMVIRIVANSADGTTLIFVTQASLLPSTGHQLVAILPLLDFSSAAPPPAQDEVIISARSDGGTGSCATFDCIKFSSQALVSNAAPIADAGNDQAVRMCSIVRLDGSRSYDPEGEPLTYEWRLIDAPPSSVFLFEGGDGSTSPEAPPTGFTDTLTSSEAETEHGVNPFVPGDVLVVRGVAYTIASILVGPFRIVVVDDQIPDDVSSEPFKILRQAGISGATTVSPSFYPDVPGFYIFDLLVNDGVNDSSPTGLGRDTVLINVLESPLPRGCNPDASFLFDYLLSFWKLIEDNDVVAEFWTALAQVAATELYTLWQIEYSKSLRDIQRTFIRRWIHYDLLLAEPLPDITTLKTVWAGVLSDPLLSTGVPGVAGTQLVVTTVDVTTPVTVPFSNPGTVSIAELRGTIENKLRDLVDDGFRVEAIENRNTGDFVLRIRLEKPFTFTEASDLPIFASYPQSNDSPQGLGAKTGDTTFDTGFPLDGLGIKEDDILVLDRVGYRVAQLVDNPADDFPYERVILKETIEGSPASWVLPGWVQSELLNFYGGLVDYGDVVEFEALEDDPATPSIEQISSFLETSAFSAAAGKPNRLAINTRVLAEQVHQSTTSVRLSRVVRRHYVPVDELIVSVPTLTQHIVIEDDQQTLRENADFFVDTFRGQAALRFQSGTPSDLGDVWEGQRPPDRLWAEYTYLNNNQLVEANFGIPVGFLLEDLAELPETVDYLSAVRGLWYAYYNGPTVRNVRIGAQILLGLPFAEEDGTIEEIRDDFILKRGRVLIRDRKDASIVRSYDYPNSLELEVNPETNEKYKVGDTVTQFAPLVEGVEVIDYVNTPRWFEGLLNQGIFHEVQKYHSFLVRVSSAAFNLSALGLTQGFVKQIKPVYKNPLFFIEFRVSDDGDEIDVTDTLQFNLTLSLYENTCAEFGWANMVDHPDPSGDDPGFPTGMKSGLWKNAVDTDDDAVAPTPPTPDAPIKWGVDKMHLCPATDLLVRCCEEHFDATADIAFVSATEADFTKTSGAWTDVGIELGDIVEVTTGSNAGFTFTVTSVTGFPTVFRGTIISGGPPVTEVAQNVILTPEVDACFQVDHGVQERFNYQLLSPASIPVAGATITPVGSNVSTLTGSLTGIRIVIQGEQGDTQGASITAVDVATADFAKTSGGWPDVDLQLGDVVEVTTGLNAGHRYEVVSTTGYPGTFRGLQVSGDHAPMTEAGQNLFSLVPRYEVAVLVNAVEITAVSDTFVANKELVAALAVAVTPGDVVTVLLRPDAGTVARTPAWDSIDVSIMNEDGTIWQVDTPIVAGIYCADSAVYP